MSEEALARYAPLAYPYAGIAICREGPCSQGSGSREIIGIFCRLASNRLQTPVSPGDMKTISTKRRALCGLLTLVTAGQMAFSPIASALDIRLVFDEAASDSPSFDPDGNLLSDIMEEAASYWEGVIKDSKTVTITYRYTADTGGLANAQITDTYPDGKPKAGDIDVDTITPSPWYFDPSPWSHEHWAMQDKLYRDLGANEQGVRFTLGTAPPEVLEVSYRGSARADAPAAVRNGFDIYTSMLHEIGHILGLSARYSSPGDVDFVTDRDFSGGTAFRPRFYVANDLSIERGHLNWSVIANNPLMCGSCAETGARRMPTALDIISIASLAGWTSLDLPRMDFLGAQSPDFSTAANWMGNRIPDSSDAAYIRRTGATDLSRDVRVNRLHIGGQSVVYTGNRTLAVNSSTTLRNDQGGFIKPMILVEAGGHLETRELIVRPDTIFSLDQGSALVTDFILNEGDFQGNGEIDVRDGFFNDGGVIQGMNNRVLTLRSGGGATLDLDGQGTRETGTMEAHSGDLKIDDLLTDSISSTVSVRTGRFVEFVKGWTLDEEGELILDGGVNPDPAGRAKIKGRGTLRGAVTVDNQASMVSPITGYDGSDPIYGSAHTISGNAEVSLADSDDRLTLFGATIERGAEFSGQGALWSGTGSELELRNRVHIGVSFVNRGHRLTMQQGEVGKVSAKRLTLQEPGTINFGLIDLPQTDEYDQFEVERSASIGGTLEVIFGVNLPPIGTRWKIIEAASVSGAFSQFEYSGLSPFRTAYLEYFEREVHVVIGGPRIISQLRIPDEWPVGTVWPLPRFEDLEILVEEVDPEVIRVFPTELVAVGVGTSPLRVVLKDQFENRRVIEQEVTVIASEGNLTSLIARGDMAAWLESYVDGEHDRFGGRLDVDDDGDGVTRLWEYVHGGNPVGADPQAMRFRRENGKVVALEFRVARRALSRFAFQLERSQDGDNWTTIRMKPTVSSSGAGEHLVRLVWALENSSPEARGKIRDALFRLRIGYDGDGDDDETEEGNS